MLAALHPTRIQKASYDHVDARGAVAGSKGGERVRFIDWCVQHQHPLPRSFLDMMPKRRKKQTVIQKNTGKRTREAVTAEAGGAAAAAGGAAAAAGGAAAAVSIQQHQQGIAEMRHQQQMQEMRHRQEIEQLQHQQRMQEMRHRQEMQRMQETPHEAGQVLELPFRTSSLCTWYHRSLARVL
jgi:hypothetical protein